MAKAVEFRINIKSEDGGVLKRLTVEADGLDDILSEVGKTAADTGNRLREMADKSLVFETAVRSIRDLSDMVGGLAEPFDSFETAMRSANTMAGKSGDEFEALTGQITELSKTIPLAREELANGLYQVISNGVPEDNWIEFLNKSSRSAVGGIADLGETVTVTSTLIKNYGLEWDQAGNIQDKIQMTAKNGVTSFEQLAQALPRVSGSAAQLGVSMDELMAVFATTTGVTGNTAEVSTQLAAVLNSLIKPSTEATKAANEMGIGFNAASVQAAGGLENFLLGLDASIQEYAAKTGQLSQTIYGQLFGSAEAMRLLGSLTGEQKEKFSQNIGAMADSAGSIDAAFENMASTGESLKQTLANQMHAMMDWAGSIASTSAPYVEWIANSGIALLSMVQLSGGIKTVVTWLKAVKVATLAQAAAAKVVAVASNLWKVAQIALNFVLSANPIGIVVMAIAALVGALIAAYNNCETFRNICDAVWAVVKDVASAVWDFLVKAFEKASAVIKKAWEWVKKFFGIKDETTARQTADIEKNTKATQANTKAKTENAQAALKKNKKQNAPVTDSDKNKDKDKDKYSGKHLIANATSYKELGNNIQYYQNKLETANGTDAKTITLYAKKIAALQKQQDAITELQEVASRPTELKTLKDIDAEIAYQQSLRENASAEELAGIDAEIQRLNDLKTAFERNAHVDVGIDKIQTYRQLEKELQYYTDLLKTATETERLEIQKQINALNDLKKKWDETLDDLKKPEDISRLNTIRSLDDAISYYQTKQKNASASEIDDIQRTVLELEKKRDALKQLARIPEMQDEVAKLDGMDGKTLKLELKTIGLDGVKKRIKELQDMLADTKSPMDESQRKSIKKLISSYEDYEKRIRKSNVTLGKSWSTVKGVGSGITSLTDALQGNRDAWSTITGVVDAAIQIYEGINGIISIIDALTAATGTSNTVVAASGVAATTAATAKTAAAPEEIAASVATMAAVKAEAMAYRELAASEFMAAHAYIPFAGAGIAAGFIDMMQGLVASVAVTPFANGGIVYGPTLALMGEYSGAKNNPEVIAPLNKLKSLIGNNGGGGGGIYELKVRGKDLVAVLANETRINRKGTNIKI
ncbi:MAG TPA: phage tail tape measure protein [Prevotellaceae bacterium]|nr:phage tail tape measure protein [Prevotellaceae bacterium]